MNSCFICCISPKYLPILIAILAVFLSGIIYYGNIVSEFEEIDTTNAFDILLLYSQSNTATKWNYFNSHILHLLSTEAKFENMRISAFRADISDENGSIRREHAPSGYAVLSDGNKKQKNILNTIEQMFVKDGNIQISSITSSNKLIFGWKAKHYIYGLKSYICHIYIMFEQVLNIDTTQHTTCLDIQSQDIGLDYFYVYYLCFDNYILDYYNGAIL